MKTFEFNERSGDDRRVHLSIPVDNAGEPYHLVVHLEPAADKEKPEYLSEDFINETAGKWVGEFPSDKDNLVDWPPGFFERTAGRWIGPLERAPQGDYEQRAKL
jgi:hypothetical protein